MKKFISLVILLSVMCSSTIAHSQSLDQTDPGFVILDVLLYRPIGLAVTVIGAAAFIGLSPLTALASIPKPHDAFNKVSNILILAPAAYTFIRPIGDRDFPYHVSQYKHNPPVTPNNAMLPKQSVTPAADIKLPQGNPGAGKGL